MNLRNIASSELYKSVVVSDLETTENERMNTLLSPSSNVQYLHFTHSSSPEALFNLDFNKQIKHLTFKIAEDDSTH